MAGRQLIEKWDGRSHVRYGTEFITLEGGISVGAPCEAFAHHGYNSIQKETMAVFKAWSTQGV